MAHYYGACVQDDPAPGQAAKAHRLAHHLRARQCAVVLRAAEEAAQANEANAPLPTCLVARDSASACFDAPEVDVHALKQRNKK